jgi:UDP-3-O-[3-hydroxymyristoyl] glucosamine N-acyltransferase
MVDTATKQSMPEAKTLTASEVAAHINGKVIGNGALPVNRVAGLEAAGEGEIAYVEEEKLFAAAKASRASCVLIPEGFLSFASQDEDDTEKAFIEVERPKLAFARIAKLLHPRKQREPAIHSSAIIDSSANIALTVFIGPNVCIGENATVGAGTRIETGVVIGDNVSVGRDCVLHPGVVLYDGVTLGDRIILHAGVCIGADGFGYVRDDMGYHKFPQIGTVTIEDDVELGAYTCVDRAALGRTRVGRGTKIDNLVQVGHNVDIGERVVIASQTGISGSTVIEDDAVIGGQVGFGDHARVQSGAVIGSKAGVLPGKIVRPGVWWGVPVQPLDEYKRRNAHIARLPQMREELKELRERVRELEERLLEQDSS